MPKREAREFLGTLSEAEKRVDNAYIDIGKSIFDKVDKSVSLKSTVRTFDGSQVLKIEGINDALKSKICFERTNDGTMAVVGKSVRIKSADLMSANKSESEATIADGDIFLAIRLMKSTLSSGCGRRISL